MPLRAFIAVLAGGILGGATYALLLPWGEPCALQPDAGHGCDILFTNAQQTLRNVLFFVIHAVAGCAGALVSRGFRYVTGIGSALAAPVLGRLISRATYGMAAPAAWDLAVPGTVASIITPGISLSLCGAFGALLSRTVVPAQRQRRAPS